MLCPLKCDSTSEDVQEHILKCHVVLDQLQADEIEAAHFVEYNDVFGNTKVQKAAVKVFMRLLQVRSNLLEPTLNTSTPASGPSLDTASPASQGGNGDKPVC